MKGVKFALPLRLHLEHFAPRRPDSDVVAAAGQVAVGLHARDFSVEPFPLSPCLWVPDPNTSPMDQTFNTPHLHFSLNCFFLHVFLSSLIQMNFYLETLPFSYGLFMVCFCSYVCLLYSFSVIHKECEILKQFFLLKIDLCCLYSVIVTVMLSITIKHCFAFFFRWHILLWII